MGTAIMIIEAGAPQGSGEGKTDWTTAREAQVKRLLEAAAPGKWEIVPGHTQLTGLGEKLNGTLMIQAAAGQSSYHKTKNLSVVDGQLNAGFCLQTPWC